MSVTAAIDTAVRLQLAREKPNVVPSYKAIMKDAGGYGYDTPSMLLLLEQISARLKIDSPPLNYDWGRTDLSKCLEGSLLSLIGLIACDTVIVGGSKA